MRISDWSSDVCSSDLVRRQGDVLLGPGADRGDRGLRVALDAAGDDRRVHPLLLHLLHEAGDRLAHVDHDEIGAGTVAQDPQAALERSEEHTSELQSLMRISYAVFCLQKKNK